MENSKEKTKVVAIKCPYCKDTIYSRARHDFRTCSCGKYSIDGGFDYNKLSFPPDLPAPELFDLEINASREELFEDWNYREDKFGLITNKEKNSNLLKNSLPKLKKNL